MLLPGATAFGQQPSSKPRYHAFLNRENFLREQRQLRVAQGEKLLGIIAAGQITNDAALAIGYQNYRILGDIERLPMEWEGKPLKLGWAQMESSGANGAPPVAQYLIKDDKVVFNSVDRQSAKTKLESLASTILHEATHRLQFDPTNFSPVPDAIAPRTKLERRYGRDVVEILQLTEQSVEQLTRVQKYFFSRTEMKAYLHEFLVDAYVETGAFPRSRTELWAAVASALEPAQVPESVLKTLQYTPEGDAACRKYGSPRARLTQFNQFASLWKQNVGALASNRQEAFWNTVLPNATAEMYNDLGAVDGWAALRLARADSQGAREFMRLARSGNGQMRSARDLNAIIQNINGAYAGQLVGDCAQIAFNGVTKSSSSKSAEPGVRDPVARRACVEAFERFHHEKLSNWEKSLVPHPAQLQQWRQAVGGSYIRR
jgi:hypothetical protein